MQLIFLSTDPHSDRAKLTSVPDFSDFSMNSINVAIDTCGHDPACIANRIFRGPIAEQLRMSNAVLTERDDIEETYRDYCCGSHEKLLPSKPWPTEVCVR